MCVDVVTDLENVIILRSKSNRDMLEDFSKYPVTKRIFGKQEYAKLIRTFNVETYNGVE